MSDMKLFRVGDARIKELERRSGGIDKSLQTLIESNLDTLLGVRFVASEYAHTGLGADPVDTLGVDENGAPVVVKYKRALNENVVTQGLYYLDWINDHKEAIQALVATVLAPENTPALYWPGLRLVCISGDFNRFDRHAAAQIKRNIDLVEYCQFDIGFLMLSLVVSNTDPAVEVSSQEAADTATAQLEAAPKAVFDLFQALLHFVKALGDDVQVQALQDSFSFRRMKSFTWVGVRPKARKIQLYLPLDPQNIELEAGFSRDMSKRDHPGSGRLEVILRKPEDLEKAKPLIVSSYQQN